MKKLLLILTMSVMAVVVMSAETLTDEFKSSGWFTQTSAGNKSEITATSTTTNIEYSYFQCYKNASIGVMMCKNYESYLSLTAPFGVQKLEITVPKGASAKAVVDILANGNIIVSDLKFDQNSSAAHTYAVNIPEEYQAQGVKLTIKKQKLTKNDVNAQIGSVTVTKSEIQGSEDKVAKPTFTPPAGRYTEAQNVTIACATEGATLEYSTDDETWLPYSEAIPVTESTTLYAKATKDGESATASADYVIKTLPVVSSIADMYEKIAKPAAGASSEQFVVDFESVVIASASGNNYIFDGEKYSLIYKQGLNLASTTKVAKGWTATLKNYGGLYQIEPAGELTTEEGGILPGPTVVTADAVTVDNQALYALLKNVTVSDATPVGAKAYTVVVDGKTINCFNRFAVPSQPAGEYDVACVISVNKGDAQILPISFSKVEAPVKLGDIVVTYGDDNTPVENNAELTGDKAVVAGTVFNFSAENATSIVVTDADDNVIVQGESSTTWTATETDLEILTVTATREGETPKILSFMLKVVPSAPVRLGAIKVVYGDGVEVVKGSEISVEVGTTFTITAENAASIAVESIEGNVTSSVDGSLLTFTAENAFELGGVSVTATLGDQSDTFDFYLTVTEPVQPAGVEYIKVTSIEDIVPGKHYILVGASENASKVGIMGAAASATSTKYRQSVDVTDNTAISIKDSYNITESMGVCQFEIVSHDGAYAIKLDNGKYLAVKNYSTKSSVDLQEVELGTKSDNYDLTKFNISIASNGEATIENGNFIKFNSTNPRFKSYFQGQSPVYLYTTAPVVPRFDEKAGEKSISFTAKNGELHAWVIEYDAEDNVVKENDVDVAETPASIMAKAPAADNTSWTNKVAEENEEFVVTAPETEGNYKMIRAKAVYNGLHSAEVVRGITYEGGVLSGVEAVVAEDADAAVEYFNLQGVRVDAEQPGLYIRRQGNKVSKVVIR